jgi:hypothetical protein
MHGAQGCRANMQELLHSSCRATLSFAAVRGMCHAAEVLGTLTCIHHLLGQLCVVSCNVAQAPGGSLFHSWVKLLEAGHQTVQGTTVNHSLRKLR